MDPRPCAWIHVNIPAYWQKVLPISEKRPSLADIVGKLVLSERDLHAERLFSVDNGVGQCAAEHIMTAIHGRNGKHLTISNIVT